ncbi:MAG: tRNA-specific 2-thiouridylase [Bacteroidaceae bacterium]|nr:tRNA-specific 2-thiouridylase [Bacteroidaceae bacterium]
MKNIAVLISGGVDSAVVVHQLCEQGYRPDLHYIKIGMEGEDSSCSAEEDIELSQATARKYGLKLEVTDLQKEYWEQVVGYAIERVKQGLTPNPDVMCNRFIKFGAFEERIGKDYDLVATGHYATRYLPLPPPKEGASVTASSILPTEFDFVVDASTFPPSLGGGRGRFYLGTAKDPVKDQTDFLAQLSYDQLRHTIFPIGHLMKEEVREIALKAGLPSARRKDSQGICFLGKINYNDFLRKFMGEKEGRVIDIETGKVVGTHRGYWFHTIGQRKGLGLGGGPWFVVKKNIKKNIIFVAHGWDTQLQYGHDFRLADMHFITANPWDSSHPEGIPITFKVRHVDHFMQGTITLDDEGYHIHSDQPIQGIAPGQFGCIYDAEHRICYGSGEIGIYKER